MEKNTYATERDVLAWIFCLVVIMGILFLMLLYFSNKVKTREVFEKKIELKKIYPRMFLGGAVAYIPVENINDILLIDMIAGKVNALCPQYQLGQVSDKGIWFFVR